MRALIVIWSSSSIRVRLRYQLTRLDGEESSTALGGTILGSILETDIIMIITSIMVICSLLEPSLPSLYFSVVSVSIFFTLSHRYDSAWLDRFGGSMTWFLRDIVNPSRGDPFFAVTRCRDWFAGHSWGRNLRPSRNLTTERLLISVWDSKRGRSSGSRVNWRSCQRILWSLALGNGDRKCGHTELCSTADCHRTTRRASLLASLSPRELDLQRPAISRARSP